MIAIGWTMQWIRWFGIVLSTYEPGVIYIGSPNVAVASKMPNQEFETMAC